VKYIGQKVRWKSSVVSFLEPREPSCPHDITTRGKTCKHLLWMMHVHVHTYSKAIIDKCRLHDKVRFRCSVVPLQTELRCL
jgi:hypothetical protein